MMPILFASLFVRKMKRYTELGHSFRAVCGLLVKQNSAACKEIPGAPGRAGVIKSACGLSSWKWGQECPQNPQAGKPALRVAQTFLSAGSGDFPVACPSPTFNHTLGSCPE